MSDDNEDNTEEFSEEAKNFLSTLTPSEAEILRERFNVEMAAGKSPTRDLDQLKNIQKRIREIEEKARIKNAPTNETE